MIKILTWLLNKAAEAMEWLNPPRPAPDKTVCLHCGANEVVYHWEQCWAPESSPVWECKTCGSRWMECYGKEGEIDNRS